MSDYLQAFREMIRNNNWVVLDTETTGLNWPSEIVQIGVVNGLTGEVLVDSLVRPVSKIPVGASAVHGITDEMVADAPEWAVVRAYVEQAIQGRDVVIYNAQYDWRLLSWTDRLHFGGRVVDWSDDRKFWCAMEWYAEWHGETNEYYDSFKWQRLTDAVQQMGLKVEGAHGAVGDCLMTRALVLEVVRRMAEADIEKQLDDYKKRFFKAGQ